MKLLRFFCCIFLILLSMVNSHDHSLKTSKCGFKHNLIPELGIGEELSEEITQDLEKRKLYSQSHPFKIHVDTSNVRGISNELKEYLVNVIAKRGNEILASKIGITGYQVVPRSRYYSKYCNYQHIVSVPNKYSYENTNADFLLFLATDDTGNDGTLAYATACFTEKGTKRPNVGLAVFNPYYLDPNKGKLDNDIATYVHEVLHALVFSSQLWANFPLVIDYKKRKRVEQYYIDDYGIHRLRGENLLAVVKDHFGCDDIEGVPLEDDGGEGSKGGHFERIVFGDETMVSEDVGVAKFSKVTLALMKDSGWYDIDLSKGDYYTWGKGEGCQLFNKTCNQGQIEEICDQNNNFGCDKTYRYKMNCSKTSFTNGCNIKMKDQNCNRPSSNGYFFEKFGISSRCQEFFYHGKKYAGCVEIRCNRSKTAYQVTLQGNEPKQFVCYKENEIKTPYESSGQNPTYQYVCENPKLICRNMCPKDCYLRGKCLEDQTCDCDFFYSGNLCGTFKGCQGLSRSLCSKLYYSNKFNNKNYSNQFDNSDYDRNYTSYTSWTDLQKRYLYKADSGL